MYVRHTHQIWPTVVDILHACGCGWTLPPGKDIGDVTRWPDMPSHLSPHLATKLGPKQLHLLTIDPYHCCGFQSGTTSLDMSSTATVKQLFGTFVSWFYDINYSFFSIFNQNASYGTETLALNRQIYIQTGKERLFGTFRANKR